ncbi:MAG: alpha/beta hydrolase, partial [Gammaproteobacteria bacterium]
MLESIALNPDIPPENCIIWLHGLGADGSDFVPVARQMQLQAPCRYIFPHAPVRPVGINNGMEMRAWYDIDASGSSTLQDIMQSVHEVQAILDDQIAQGLPANRILLAGFSQGGVIA